METDSSHLTWPAPQNEYRVEGTMFSTFPNTFFGLPDLKAFKHTFIKLHQVTNAQESVLIVSRMSFCTKGIPARSCRIQCLAKSGEKPSPLGRRCPSGRMRGETHGFQALTHRLRRSPLSRRARVHGSIMDSATPPQGSAQNDSIA